MKKDLLRLQAKMKKAKIPVDRSVFNDKNNSNITATDYSLKQRLDKYQIESDRLTNQLEYPSQRTRFKISYGPSYSLDPANKKKLKNEGDCRGCTRSIYIPNNNYDKRTYRY